MWTVRSRTAGESKSMRMHRIDSPKQSDLPSPGSGGVGSNRSEGAPSASALEEPTAPALVAPAAPLVSGPAAPSVPRPADDRGGDNGQQGYAPWTRGTRATAPFQPAAADYQPLEKPDIPNGAGALAHDQSEHEPPPEPEPQVLPPEEERDARRQIAQSLEENVRALRAELGRADLTEDQRAKLEQGVEAQTQQLRELKNWLHTNR